MSRRRPDFESNGDAVSDCLHSAAARQAAGSAREDIGDRVRGMTAGTIIGDMLGLTLMGEAGPADTARPVILPENHLADIVGGGVLELSPGDWTDDTSMMLALAESLHETGGVVEPDNERAHYAKWFYEGKYSATGSAIDVGATTARAMTQGAAASDRRANGNGALMRSAPITAHYLRNTDAKLAEAAGASCRVTHAHPIAMFTNIIYCLLLKRLAYDHPLHDAFAEILPMYGTLIADTREIFMEPIFYVTTGYCVTTLQTAAWIVEESSTFEEAVLKAVNLGGDADTIGAVTGALAGARFGFSAIPDRFTAHVMTHRILRHDGAAALLR